MADFVQSGRVIDAILALMAIEAIVLSWYGRRTGRGVATSALVINMLAGGSLMLAIRSALTDAGPLWVVTWLMCALAAHCADVWQRWRTSDAVSASDREPTRSVRLEHAHK